MKPGSYREPLISVLSVSDPKLAGMVERKELMLAVAGSISGGVVRREDLAPKLVEALEASDPAKYAEHQGYYVSGLQSGRLVPVLSVGVDYIGTGETAEEALAKTREAQKRAGEREWKPGELYMRS